jgi:hypothetical protein
MPPASVPALLVLLVAVLPGSVYPWAFERQASWHGVGLADRVLRFVGVSAAFALLFSWPAYGTWRGVYAGRSFGVVQFGVAWVALGVGLGLPALTGTAVGGLYASRHDRHGWQRLRRWLPPPWERRLLLIATGRNREPTAWDAAFARRRSGVLRIRTLDGLWFAGPRTDESAEGRYPHEPDIWLEEAWRVDADGTVDPVPAGYGVDVPASRIAWVELHGKTPGREAK